MAQLTQNTLSEMWTGSGGQGVLFHKNTVVSGGTNSFVVGSTLNGMNNSDVLIQKFDRKGVLLWQQSYAGLGACNDAATDAYFYSTTGQGASSNLFVTGTIFDSVANGQDLFVQKYSDAGQLLWTYKYHGSDLLPDDVGTSIFVEGSKVYIIAASATDSTEYDFLTIALNINNGSVSWMKRYDFHNLKEVPAKISYKSGRVYVTGASQDSLTGLTWSIATVTYDAANGTTLNSKRINSNVSSGVNDIADFALDSQNNLYLVGAKMGDTTDLDIAIYKLDDSLNLIWEQFYDFNELADKGSGLKLDASGNIYIVGSSSVTSLGTEVAILKLDPNGNEIWRKEYGGLSSADDKGVNLVLKGDKLFVSASVNDDGQRDYKLYALDTSGVLLTTARFEGAANLNDEPQGIAIDAYGEIIVTGKEQTGASTFVNKTVKYAFDKKSMEFGFNGDSIPVFIKDELTIRFNKNVVNTNTINKKNFRFGELNQFIDSNTISILDSKLGISTSRLKTYKIFKRMTVADSISVTRLGDTIKTDAIWATLSVKMPLNSNLSLFIDSLNTIKNYILYVEKNRIGKYNDIPNDYEFNNFEQTGLKGNFMGIEMVSTVSGGSLVNQGAWEIEKGKSGIKVGVFDSGIDWNHEDFGGNDIQNTVVKGGWDFMQGIHPYDQTTPDPSGHGTKCAGIIGAIRNNDIGIAGIAGGDYENNIAGVSLYSMRVLGSLPTDSLFDINTMADAIIEGAIYNPATQYGFGLHVQNYSWSIVEDYEDFPSIYYSLRNAINIANQNHCVQVASAGNLSDFEQGTYLDSAFYPASYNNSWILKTGASCSDSKRCEFSAIGNNIDIIAPGQANIVYTLSPSVSYAPAGTYSPFEGTSAAAPHVSGVSALLLSKHNPDYNPLYPNQLEHEDVEFLLKSNTMPRNSDDVYSGALPSINEYNGHGLLNAYKSLQKTRLPYRVRHFDHLLYWDAATLIASNQNIVFPEGIDGVDINAQIGTTDIYKITHTFNHTLPVNEQFVAGWVRKASSDLYGLTDTLYNMHWGDLVLDNVSASQATVSGYYYKTQIILGTDTTYRTFPEYDTLGNFKFGYSIHTIDSSYHLGLNELENSLDGISVYPNPSNNEVNISLTQDQQMNLEIYDIMGKLIGQFTIENKHFIVNVSSFNTGIYLFVFKDDQRKEVKRIIKN